ncbi:1-acyl-sn-glycerol-3-phosphate acyltransferase [Sphingobacterium chuzhouense]|uniref:1-acyl-sn-glycerol-3-phosphate acyltransferase n=1 Tax=Sphingobacterium chuzhouense TaxID=1742264 RepID=A0ABR7XUL5_9SPHI|nr:1-acyl-sn-glycerol-3-phosphate acyltransferase [Sphingobacterium chuzhouense]MBD1422731.1 1-acyl-sn-glycerol-3-phosphate acyltransferase [Sphingobacterium chuzhouense]
MFYSVLRLFIRLGLKWYAPELKAKNLQLALYNYPTIVIANHPNSFFDALVIAAYAPVKICFLARGDIFKHPIANVILRWLYMLPVYKRNDDEDFAVKNDFTFDECMRRLAAGQHVLIFPEGRSRNLWELQPFMNGGLTSLLERSYRAELPLQIQTYILNYNSFRHVPKAIELEALPPLDTTEYIAGHQVRTADIIRDVRHNLRGALVASPLVDGLTQAKNSRFWHIPAKIGYYTQFWFYRVWRDYVKKKTEGTIFYDSLLFSVLLFSYPIFVLLCSVLIGKFTGFWIGFFVFAFLPTTAYAMVRYQRAVTETETNIPKRNSWNETTEPNENMEDSV